MNPKTNQNNSFLLKLDPVYRIRSYTSRFLNKSKSTAVVPPDDDPNNTGDDSDSKYGTGRSRYLALKERRNLLARSRSSHNFGGDDDDALDEPVSPTTASPTAYLASRCDITFFFNSFFLLFFLFNFIIIIGN